MATIEEARAQAQQQHDAELIARAVAILEAKQCEFKIITSSGEEFGSLVAERPPTRVKVNDFVEETRYIEIVDAIKEFGADIVPVPEGKQGDKSYVEGLRSCVYNRCKKQWGRKTFKVVIAEDCTHIKVTREGEQIEVPKE